MTPLQITLALLVLLGVAVLLLLIARRHERQVDIASREILARKTLEAQAEVEELKQNLAIETRRRVEVVEVISQMEKERNIWKEKYWDAALGHSAAQQMLLRELERISRLAISKGIARAELSEACKRVVSEYAARHAEVIKPSEPDPRIFDGTAIAEKLAPGVDSPAT